MKTPQQSWGFFIRLVYGLESTIACKARIIADSNQVLVRGSAVLARTSLCFSDTGQSWLKFKASQVVYA